MRKLMLLLAVAFAMGAQAQKLKSFEIKEGNFWRNGKVVNLHSGEMHYERIPREYWRHRLQMVRAMGLNTVATYVFWNFHEPEPGQWNFAGDRNIAEYIRIAGEEGLMVILRPGPYACAEWEYGGLPYWLQNVEGLEVRRDNELFLKQVRTYFEQLYAQVKDLLVTHGGPIVMVQCENEFGSYVQQRKDIPLEEHKQYMAKIKQIISEVGFDVPLFTSDGSWLFEGGSTQGALPTANGEGNPDNLRKCVNQYHGGRGPYMIAEFYTGWLDHWGENFKTQSPDGTVANTRKWLTNDVSFNYYMVHGGTNFAFWAGANYDNGHDIQPDLTSYDYDAPISEAGWATRKYTMLRELIMNHTGEKLPAVPDSLPVIVPQAARLTVAGNLLQMANSIEPVEADEPMTFEQLKQCSGYVLYSRHFNQPISGELKIEGVRDYAVVYVNGVKVGVLNRNKKRYSLPIDIPFDATLQILVENMGRINYGAEIAHNNKGIVSPVTIDGHPISGSWEMRQLPMSEVPQIDKDLEMSADEVEELKGLPTVYKGAFEVEKPGDTFLHMEAWGKGIVYVNGHNLGRYWYIGPQQTLYLPGCWLRKGKNDIVIFEQLNPNPQTEVKFTDTPILTKQQKNNE